MDFNNKFPQWKNEGVEPSKDLLESGYKGGYKPPSTVFNWFWSKTMKAVTELQSKLSGHETENKADLAAANTRIDDVSTAVDQHEGKITELQTGIAQHENKITGLHTTVGQHESEIGALQTDVNNIQADLPENLTQTLNEHSTAIAQNTVNLAGHIDNKSNPHGVTKVQLGLANVDNTSDMNKPLSTAMSSALAAKADLVNGKVPEAQLPESSGGTVPVSKGGTGNTEFVDNGILYYSAPNGKVENILMSGSPDDPSVLVSVAPFIAPYGASLKGLLEELNEAQNRKYATVVVGTQIPGYATSPADFVCDGRNDQVAINTAILALPSNGGKVILLEGTYNITAAININKPNVSIEGMGNSTVLKRMWNSSSLEGVLNIGNSNISVQNLSVDGSKSEYSSENNCGIYIKPGNINNTITNNTCNKSKYAGICSNSDNDNIVNTCNKITENTCNDNGSNGIYNYGNNDIIIGNICNSNSKVGIVNSSRYGNNIVGNMCDGNVEKGILNSGMRSTILGNTCNFNTGSGIYSGGEYTTIVGNTCIANNIGIEDRGRNTISGNSCNNNSTGIIVGVISTITGNNCYDNKVGIRIDGDKNTITGNQCVRSFGEMGDYTSEQHTILINGRYNLISSNCVMGKPPTTNGATNTIVNNKDD